MQTEVTSIYGFEIWRLCKIYLKNTSQPDPQHEKVDMSVLPVEKTSEADYVWLPIRFDGEKPYIEWLDEWKIEDYE